MQETDGATGAQTVDRSTTVDNRTVGQQQAGSGPVRSCIKPGLAPAWLQPERCDKSRMVTAPNGHRFAVDCVAPSQIGPWQRINERTWQHRYAVPVSAGTTAQVPAATSAMLAPAMAALEEAARSSSPEHAAMARQQLAALRGTAAPSGGVSATVSERWTRIADQCGGVP